MRTRFRTLIAGTSAAMLLTACARMPGGTGGSASYNVGVSVDSALRVAATQLQHHGYTVQASGANSLVTIPRAIPAHLQDKDPKVTARSWMVQVTANRQAFMRGTEISVQGYLVPPSAATTGTGAPTVQSAIPVTNKHMLHQEVRAIAGWIADGANRKK